MKEVHIWAGDGLGPKRKSGEYSWSPGGYNNPESFVVTGLPYTFAVSNFDPLGGGPGGYYIFHGVVCSR